MPKFAAGRTLAATTCAALLAVVTTAVGPAVAVTSRMHRLAGATDLLTGDAEDVVISSRGTLRLARASEVVVEDLEGVWAINRLLAVGNTLYIATSPNGGVYRFRYGELTRLYPPVSAASERPDDPNGAFANEHVFALGLDLANRLLAGISGDHCRLLRFTDTEADVLFESSQARYIFDVARDDPGNLYLATGPEGRLFRIDALGRSSRCVYQSRDENLLSLLWHPDGALYGGTDGRGLIFRYQPDSGETTILYDSDQPEVPALALAPRPGTAEPALYGCGTSVQLAEAAADRGTEQPPPPAGRPERLRSEDPNAEPVGAGGRSLTIANTRTSSSSEPEGGTPLRRPRGRAGGPRRASSLVRIEPEGYVTEVLQENAVFFCLAAWAGQLMIGTGNEGRLLGVDLEMDQKTTVYEDPRAGQITCLEATDEGLYLGTANPARVVRISERHVPRGTYTTKLIDAEQPAHWGKVQLEADLPEGCRLTVAARTGNVNDANDPTFSPWSEPVVVDGPVALDRPLGRYCQLRLTLTTDRPEDTAVVREIAVASTIPNLAPIVESIEVEPVDPERRPGVLRIHFRANDRNDDTLLYEVSLRKVGGDTWIVLKDDLEEDRLEWDSRTVADGRYEFRVVADDRRDNPLGTERRGSRVSDVVVIDNSGPVIRGHFTETLEGVTTLGLRVRDEWTAIARLDYVLDGQVPWRNATPDDLVYDTTSEDFTLRIADLEPGPHWITLRVQDDLHNTTYRTFEVRVPPADGSRP